MTEEQAKCIICRDSASEKKDFNSGKYRFDCKRCGVFYCSEEAKEDIEEIPRLNSDERAYASSWLRENQGYVITTSNFNELFSAKPPGVIERSNRLLHVVEAKTRYIGRWVNVLTPDVQAKVWARRPSEITALSDLLHQQGFVEISTKSADGRKEVRLTVRGWAHIETAEIERKSQAFVAMWFHTDMDSTYSDAIAPAIISAGYRPLRVDMSGSLHRIDDEIMTQIRRSRFLVADLTGQRQSVYYEAGFAHGLEIPVFFTVRQDDHENVHFDIRQYPFIVWSNKEELRGKLSNRIEGNLGKGPV
jgi:DNA-binding MarR family transcriptional regulator